MTFVDIWAAIAASIACSMLALRGNMLKPHQTTWAPAPTPVWLAIMALAIATGMAAVTLWTGAHATPREAVVYTVLATTSAVMAWNLHRNGRARAHQALHGRAGLVTTLEIRDPAAFAARARRGAAAKRKEAGRG